MDLGGVLSATAHLISDSAAWRVPSESDANVDVARGTLPPARWTSGANVGPPPPPRVPTLAADVGRQGGRCTSHLTPPTLPRYLGKVLPCRYIRPLLRAAKFDKPAVKIMVEVTQIVRFLLERGLRFRNLCFCGPDLMKTAILNAAVPSPIRVYPEGLPVFPPFLDGHGAFVCDQDPALSVRIRDSNRRLSLAGFRRAPTSVPGCGIFGGRSLLYQGLPESTVHGAQ